MKPGWALSLPLAEAARVGPLRAWPGVECLALAPTLWLRGATLDEVQAKFCRRLPGANRFTLGEDGQLVRLGALVPLGWLPDGPWQPLRAWLQIDLPAAGDPGQRPPPVHVRLVRSAEPREPNWLLTSLQRWTAYATTAPSIRLARWSFAADRQGNVIVRGAPLPPLAGVRLVEVDGIVVPAGWTWAPAVEAAVLRVVLGLSKNDCAVWSEDGSWQKISADDCVQATRSAARLTQQEFARGQ